MGVPAFFRWLSEKYPKTVVEMLEQRNPVVDGVAIPLDLREANPNNIEYDNLYVDMNGLIHPCSHPEDRDSPTSEAEMYVNVTKYVDRLFAAVRPRQLLFLAIDGVAPRAKMNQQRSRRFRAAHDAKDRAAMLQDVMDEMTALGMDGPNDPTHAWDSNVITPGTEFMDRLSVYLWFYILDRMNKYPAWRNIKVILSDAHEPGEGEHKIMNYIRTQRQQTDYNPNQHHILHGLDADLIMLALATHEPYFTILREQVLFGKQQKNKPEKSEAQKLLEENFKSQNGNGNAISAISPQDEWVYAKPFEALHVNILREYLQAEFLSITFQVLPFPYDFERVIDDFVFLCFFVGNDFLPHLPSLDIRDGAIDFLMVCYKEMLPSLGDYITSPGGNVNLTQADIILARVGEIEDEIFKRRKTAEEKSEARRNSYARMNKQNSVPGGARGVNARDNAAVTQNALVANSLVAVNQPKVPSNQAMKNKAAADRLRGIVREDPTTVCGKRSIDEVQASSETVQLGDCDGVTSSAVTMEETITIEEEAKPQLSEAEQKKLRKEAVAKRIKEKENEKLDALKSKLSDDIKLHQDGWKERYYEDPFKKADVEKGGGKAVMCKSYVEGLCWVLKYYYIGCPSWSWYYPFHYAPFASDLLNIDQYTISFELSQPFRAVEQLLAVLPSESSHAVPSSCQPLMTDPSQSSIIDLYDGNVPLDPNGKHLPWLWVLLLPFIDENRIHQAYNNTSMSFSLDDIRRNALGTPLIFLHRKHALSVDAKLNVLATEVVDSDLVDDFMYRADVERDVDVIAHTARTTGTTPKSDVEPIQYKNVCADGFTGIVNAAPAQWFAPIDKAIVAPIEPYGAFDNLKQNQILCYGFQFPPDQPTTNSIHQSKLLPGLNYPERVLSDIDLMPRRPPRLNKGFSMMDIAASTRSSYNDHQQANAFGGQERVQQQYGGNRYEAGLQSAARMVHSGMGLQQNNRGYDSRDERRGPADNQHHYNHGMNQGQGGGQTSYFTAQRQFTQYAQNHNDRHSNQGQHQHHGGNHQQHGGNHQQHGGNHQQHQQHGGNYAQQNPYYQRQEPPRQAIDGMDRMVDRGQTGAPYQAPPRHQHAQPLGSGSDYHSLKYGGGQGPQHQHQRQPSWSQHGGGRGQSYGASGSQASYAHGYGGGHAQQAGFSFGSNRNQNQSAGGEGGYGSGGGGYGSNNGGGQSLSTMVQNQLKPFPGSGHPPQPPQDPRRR